MILLAVSCVLLFLLYQSTIGKVKSEFNFCIDTANQSRAEDVLASCSTKEVIYQELSNCAVAVQKNGALPSLLYSPLGFKSKVDLLISIHNEDCPKNAIKSPGEGLYL